MPQINWFEASDALFLAVLALRHHPSLLLALISNLNQQFSHLVTSVRLTPSKLRRDVLIFTDPAREHGLHILPDLVLPPRLSFPSGPAGPDLTSHANRSRRNSRRPIRVRPASLASLNGGPLLPSIPASPSWEEDGSLPAGIHQLVPVTAGPRLETGEKSYFSGPFPMTERKHKKSSSEPGNITTGWKTANRPHQPIVAPLDGSLDTSEVLRDSPDRAHTPPKLSSSQAQSSVAPNKPSALTCISNGNIKVKAVTASHSASGIGYANPDTAVRVSEVPERGTILAERFPGSGSSSESGNRTATSSLKKERRPEEAKVSNKRRGGFRSLLKAMF
jgi:hypothetical protein